MKIKVCFVALVAAVIGFAAIVTPVGALPDSAVVVPSPNANPSVDYILNGVSCTSKVSCVAVGEAFGDFAPQTFALSWDGTSWTQVPTPNTDPTEENVLRSVSCVSALLCTAVGWAEEAGVERTLVLSWDGVAWTEVPSPNSSPTADNDLFGVSCTSATSCIAVGSSDGGAAWTTLVLSWDGTVWTQLASPNTSVGESNWLHSVSCLSATSCTAIGSFSPSGALRQTLVLSWNGIVWTQIASPNSDPLEKNLLQSVSCVSAISCVAVGYIKVGSIDESLVLTWDGSNWTESVLPEVSGDDGLESVSCLTASSCVAVGYSTFDSADETIVLTWDGNVWARLSSPNPNPANTNALFSVSCISAYSCTAVGVTGVGTDQTFVISLTSPEPPVPPVDPDPIVPAFTG